MKVVREHKFITAMVLAAVIAAACVFYVFMNSAAGDKAKDTDQIAQTIYDRALQCYVIEGAYPESLKYLEENYGLAVNRRDYTIVYTPYADNQPPDIRVIYKDKERS